MLLLKQLNSVMTQESATTGFMTMMTMDKEEPEEGFPFDPDVQELTPMCILYVLCMSNLNRNFLIGRRRSRLTLEMPVSFL